MKRHSWLFPFFGLLLVVVLAGCSKPEIRCPSPVDNPAHHYSAGMELVEQGRIGDAATKFERAVWCDPDFAPGYAGLAVAGALNAASITSEEHRGIEASRAFKDLKNAYKKSKTPEDEFAYCLASIRVNTTLKPGGWLKDAQKAYGDAMGLNVDENRLIYYDGREAASYFMGVAYLDAREFDRARASFAEVLSSRKDGRWNEKADGAWRKTDKIVRALGGITLGDIGKEIAVKDSVGRGDMAALLAGELKIDRLFAGRIPVKSEIDKLKPEFIPVDVRESPFRHEILTMMKWGVRGLEPVFDADSRAYLYEPEKAVTRKDFAFVLEDVLIKLTGDESMASAYFGHQRSPFPDVPATGAWYNAIMNVTTRNVMETELSGEFRPDDAVDGAEAILAVRVLRQRLNIH